LRASICPDGKAALNPTRVVRGLAGLLLIAFAAGCAPPPPVAPPETPRSGAFVYLVNHGWHVGIAVERQEVSPAIWPESAEFSGFRYLEVGWGDADYYPAARGTIGLALKAAFSSKGSVLHLAAFDAPPAEFFDRSKIIEVPLSRRGLEDLGRFIHATYARDASGRPVVVAPSLYGHGAFYRATGQYRLQDNSNNWTARALAVAGCPIDAAETITAGSLMDEARRFGRVVRGSAPRRDVTADSTERHACRCQAPCRGLSP
jgi:uncharacterized protein (TIGR02117 family)